MINIRKFIAVTLSIIFHLLLIIPLLAMNKLFAVPQSQSVGDTQVISIAMVTANISVDKTKVVNQEQEKTVISEKLIVNEDALIKKERQPEQPHKIETKVTPIKYSAPINKEVDKPKKEEEQEEKQSIQAPDNVNAYQGKNITSPIMGNTSGEPTDKNVYLARLRQTIESHKKYPARARNKQGVSIVSFSLSENGDIYAVTLQRSSGYSILDEAALKAVNQSSMQEKPPADVPRTMTISVRFSLY